MASTEQCFLFYPYPKAMMKMQTYKNDIEVTIMFNQNLFFPLCLSYSLNLRAKVPVTKKENTDIKMNSNSELKINQDNLCW